MELTEIDGYRVIRALGAGGMGQVFLVEHPRLPRRDALKLLDAGVSRSDDFKARFQREADLLAQLSHPNIVTLYDRGEFEGRLWITMEFVDGTDAARMVESTGPLPVGLVTQLVGGAGAALDYAWRKLALTHRDVKPANILVGLDGSTIESVKLADFGIAKAAGEATSLTSTGMTVGTLQYISPEAIEGHPLDNRADIYSLGCTAFQLLTGRAPFSGTSITALMAAHLQQQPPRISEVAPGLPAALDPVFARVLAKNPADRYQSCAEFVAALSAAGAGAAPVGRPVGSPVGPPAYAQTTSAPAPARPMASGPAPAAAPAPRKSRAIPVLAALAVLMVVAAVVVGVVALRGGGDKATSTATPRPDVPSVATTETTTITETSTTSSSSELPTSERAGPAMSGVRVSYTVVADTPDVEIGFAPGQWMKYKLSWSDMESRYSMNLQATPEQAENMYLAVRGSTSNHCRIRVAGSVVAVDNGSTQAVCRA